MADQSTAKSIESWRWLIPSGAAALAGALRGESVLAVAVYAVVVPVAGVAAYLFGKFLAGQLGGDHPGPDKDPGLLVCMIACAALWGFLTYHNGEDWKRVRACVDRYQAENKTSRASWAMSACERESADADSDSPE